LKSKGGHAVFDFGKSGAPNAPQPVAIKKSNWLWRNINYKGTLSEK